MGGLRKIHCDLVFVVVTEDHLKDGSRPILEFEDTASDFHGLNVIQYQGEIIQWLQREYGDHVQVQHTLRRLFIAENQGRQTYPEYRARLSKLLPLLNEVIQNIVHHDVWYLAENPEFPYLCSIRIRPIENIRNRNQEHSLCGPPCDTGVRPCPSCMWGCCQTPPLCVDLVSHPA